MVAENIAITGKSARASHIAIASTVMVAVLVLGPLPPFNLYPVDLMRALCLALFACAFNLLIGYGGLLSFGHALFFGWASYVAAHMAKVGVISLPYPVGWHAWSWFVISLPPLAPELAILFGTAVAAVLGVV